MNKILLTNEEIQSNTIFNFIWNSYKENKNSLSLVKFIDKNSSIYKKKILNQLQSTYSEIYKNKTLNKKFLIGDNFNFLDTFLISEKSFYKDKYDNLSDLVKCLALIDQIKSLKIDEIVFNIHNENVYNFLKDYCEISKIKLTIPKKTLYKFFHLKIKFYSKLIYSFLSFFKFLYLRIKIPKSKKISFNIKNIFLDYFCYFDDKKFKSGEYVSNYWGNLLKKKRYKKGILFFHIFIENNKLKTNDLSKFINNLNRKKGEKHFIIDSILNFKIVFLMYKKWLYFLINIINIKTEIKNSLNRKNKIFHNLIKNSITENLIGFNSLLNLYYHYLFDSLFKKLKDTNNKNIFYLCENQGWEKSLLSFIDRDRKKKIKVYPIISTPIRFWDLRYNFLKSELKKIHKKIEKICVMSPLSKKILQKNNIDRNKILIVESLRYENLFQKHLELKKVKKDKSILIIGDYLKSINNNMENFIIKLLQRNKEINVIAKPHPIEKFSKKFTNIPRVKISNKNLNKLSLKTNFCICSNMTSASYDLYYLNFRILILLAGDSINFSPLKNIKGVEYVSKFDDISILKKDKNLNNLDFKKNAFLFNKNYKNWSKIL